jgi:hypothetical protein
LTCVRAHLGFFSIDNPNPSIVIDVSDEVSQALVKPFDVVPKNARDVISLILTPLLLKLPVAEWFYAKTAGEVSWSPPAYFQLTAYFVSIPLRPLIFSLLQVIWH